MRTETYNKLLYAAIVLGAMSWLALGLLNFPYLAGALGISTTSATAVVNLLSAYSTVTTVISIIGAITGVGSIGSGVAASVLYMLKKYGKAKAALW